MRAKEGSLERKLTEGNVQEHLMFLAIPLIFGFILQYGINLVDLYWVGRLGSISVAAVTMGGSLIFFITTAMVGLSTGTVALISRAIGQNQKVVVNEIARQSINLTVVSYVFVGLLGYILTPFMLNAIGATPEILPEAISYLRILFLGVLILFLFLLGGAIFRGVGDTLTPMIILGAVVFVNAVLDPVFILGIGLPAMGVKGAALATLVSQFFGVVLLYFILSKKHSKIHISYKGLQINLETMKKIIKVGLPASLQMLSRSLMWIVLLSIIAVFGTSAIAAYGITIRILMLALLTSFAFGHASAVIVGQNLGKGDVKRAEKTAWLAMRYDALIMLCVSVLFYVYAKPILSLFTMDSEVQVIGAAFIRILSPVFVAMAVAIVLGRSMGGAGATIPPMVVTIITLWVIQIPLAYFLTRFTEMGLRGAWVAMALAHVIQAFLIVVIFIKGKWKTHIA